jgi:hypothetical protein
MASSLVPEKRASELKEVESVENGDLVQREAAIVEEERKLGLVASARLHWKIVFICKPNSINLQHLHN